MQAAFVGIPDTLILLLFWRCTEYCIIVVKKKPTIPSLVCNDIYWPIMIILLINLMNLTRESVYLNSFFPSLSPSCFVWTAEWSPTLCSSQSKLKSKTINNERTNPHSFIGLWKNRAYIMISLEYIHLPSPSRHDKKSCWKVAATMHKVPLPCFSLC